MISNIRALQINLEDKIHTFYQSLSEQEQLKVVFALPQFQNHLFLNAMNRSKVVTNNNSINQGMKTSYFVGQCTSNIATDSNVVFNPFCTLSPKNKKVEFENLKPSKINETEISKVILENLLAGDKHSSSLESKSSAKIKAQFDIFL